MNDMNLPNFYIYNSTFNRNSALSIASIGRDMSSPGFSYPQYHSNYVITFIKSGKGTLETRGKKYDLGANDAFLTVPDELSIQTADIKEPWELFFFSFNGSLVKEVLDKTVFKNDVVTISLKNTDLADKILDAIKYLNTNSHSELKVFEYFFTFLSYFDSLKAFPLENDDSQHKYVSEIKKYIQTNYLEPIKISEIAERLSINRSHLYRIFKNEMGIGVEDYIINIRMNHAKALLQDTSLSVSAVSALVGYKNYTTFFKRFKSATGLTPLEYRKNISQQ